MANERDVRKSGTLQYGRPELYSNSLNRLNPFHKNSAVRILPQNHVLGNVKISRPTVRIKSDQTIERPIGQILCCLALTRLLVLKLFA